MIRADVPRADERRLRPSLVAPQPDLAHAVPVDVDVPEHVVRGKEGEVAAEVAETRNHVELVRGHVLLVAREHDQVVTASELVAARDPPDVLVAQVVDLLPGLLKPREEREVPVVKSERDSEVEERPSQVDRVGQAAHVPRVAPAVPVRVREVVGLPGLRREHDGDPRAAEGPRSHDERRIADASVVGADTQEVEAARPVARTHDTNRCGCVAMRRPVDARGCCHRLAARAQIADGGECAAAVREDLERQRPGIGRHLQSCLLSGCVAGLREAGVDPLDSHDGTARACSAIDAAATASTDRQLEHVGARQRQGRRLPDELPGAFRKKTRGKSRDHVRRGRLGIGDGGVRLHDRERDARRRRQAEVDVRDVAKAVAVRAHRRQESVVAEKGGRPVRDMQTEEPRRVRPRRSGRSGGRRRKQNEGEGGGRVHPARSTRAPVPHNRSFTDP